MNKQTILLIGIIILAGGFLSAQINPYGIPFYKKYTEENFGESGQIWAIQQDTAGIMYFGCNYGLKTYDGVNWRSYINPNSTIIRSLNKDENGNIYYGAESDFGMIRPDKQGKLQFLSFYISKFGKREQDFASVWKTHITEDKIYFQSFEKIYYTHLPIEIVEKEQGDSLVNELYEIYPEQTLFHLSFEVNGKIYVREWEKGLCEIQSDSVPKLLPGGEQFGMLRIYLMLPFDENRILIGTREDGFFLYNPENHQEPFTRFNFDNNELVAASAVYGGEKISEDTYALTGLQNGIIIFNEEGKILQHFSNENDLPSAFILSSYYNPREGILWFFADEDGIYKFLLNSPFTHWKAKKEYEFSSPLSFYKDQQISYLSGSSGLYKLSEEALKINQFEQIKELLFGWIIYPFQAPETTEKQLLLGCHEGIFMIRDSEVQPVTEIQNVWTMAQSAQNPGLLYIGTDEGLFSMQYHEGKWGELQKNDSVKAVIKSILETPENIFVGTASQGLMALKEFNDPKPLVIDSLRGLPLWGQDYFVQKIDRHIVVTSGKGLFEIVNENDSLFAKNFNYFGEEYSENGYGVYKIFENQDEFILSVYESEGTDPKHQLIRFKKGKKLKKDSLFGKILPQKPAQFAYTYEDKIWIGSEKGLFVYDKNFRPGYDRPYFTLIRKVSLASDSVLFMGNGSILKSDDEIPELKYADNSLFFEFAAPYFHQEENTTYSYRLKGLSNDWSKWTGETKINFTNLPEGDYTFEVKARNIYDFESVPASFSFSILPPWYRTVWAYIGYLIAAGLLIWLFVKWYTRKLRRENEILEQKVQERTIEIREKNAQLQQSNEEILAQRDEIETQRDELEVQRDMIAEQQESIMDSIRYASRIQTAVMPPESYLNKILGEHFVLFKPRDVVSGDFYWSASLNGKTIIVAADCTGHGVPGAFMSMLGMSFLNEVVLKDQNLESHIILNRLRENVKSSLRQEGKESDTKDGMDLALLVIDHQTNTIEYSGAYNPLYLVRKGEIITYKADRMPVGIYIREKESFTKNIVEVQKGDQLYIFSDGYVDQFGGEKAQKLKSGNFKQLLLEITDKPMLQQRDLLDSFMQKWTAHNPKTGEPYEQIDDIVVIGIKI